LARPVSPEVIVNTAPKRTRRQTTVNASNANAPLAHTKRKTRSDVVNNAAVVGVAAAVAPAINVQPVIRSQPGYISRVINLENRRSIGTSTDLHRGPVSKHSIGIQTQAGLITNNTQKSNSSITINSKRPRAIRHVVSDSDSDNDNGDHYDDDDDDEIDETLPRTSQSPVRRRKSPRRKILVVDSSFITMRKKPTNKQQKQQQQQSTLINIDEAIEE
jgi:hypothetical protein